MPRRVLGILVLTFVMATFLVSAKPAFSGTYGVTGSNPGVGSYKGTLTIVPRGDVFDVHWTVSGVQYVGVGVVVNETLAVTYSGATDRSWSGVMAYRQRADGALEGRWTLLGGKGRVGTETAVRK
jgi:hypothetical protein